MSEEIPENKFRQKGEAINDSPKWNNGNDPSLITGDNCFELHCNFTQNIKEKEDII